MTEEEYTSLTEVIISYVIVIILGVIIGSLFLWQTLILTQERKERKEKP